MCNDFPPSPEEYRAALNRVRCGLATEEDANLISHYVGEIEEMVEYLFNRIHDLKNEIAKRESCDRFQRSLNEALNTGRGIYIP